MKSLVFVMLADLFSGTSPLTHGFVGSGWLHPLTGIDHMLAMIAVGAWSAQLGKRAVFSNVSHWLVSNSESHYPSCSSARPLR